MRLSQSTVNQRKMLEMMSSFGPPPPPSPSQESVDLTLLDNRQKQSVILGTPFVGIDPGKQGYTAEISEDMTVHTTPIPVIGKDYDRIGVWRLISSWKERGVKRVTIEEQQSPYGKAGPRAGFEMGRGYEMWLSMLAVAEVGCDIVRPGVWKKRMGVTIPKSPKGAERAKALKAKSIAVCKRLFPEVDLVPSARHRVPSSDMAEAILVARYGMLHGR